MFRDMESPFGQITNTTFGGGGFTSGATATPFEQNVFGFVSSIPTVTAAGTPIKFIPATDTEEMGRGGVTQTINLRLQCITCMEEYKSKSLEELQLEDYVANCKGPQPSSQHAGLFGFASQSAPFGSGANTSLFPDKPFSAGTTSMGIGGGGFTTGATASSFGQNTFDFGNSIPTVTVVGTPIKFIAATSTDEMTKGGVSQKINIRLHCISCMEEYKLKSLEELRMEDYVTNRKGPQPASQQAGLFRSATQPVLMDSGGSTSLFSNKPLFAGTTSMGTGFGSGTGAFGSTNQQAGSLFGKPTGFGAVTTTTGSETGLNLEGQSLFGQTNTPGSLFGTNTGMFRSGGPFGSFTNFRDGSDLGIPLKLGGNPLLGGSGTVSPTNQRENLSFREHISTHGSMSSGDTPLFRNLLPAHGKTDDLKPSTHVLFQKTPPASTQSKGTLRGNIKLKVKPLPGYLWAKDEEYDEDEERLSCTSPVSPGDPGTFRRPSGSSSPASSAESSSKCLKKKIKFDSPSKTNEVLDLVAKKLERTQNEFSNFGVYVADELSKLSPITAIYCQKLINDAIFEGKCGSLKQSSRIVHEDFSQQCRQSVPYTQPH